jgi:hypothetical protein
MGGYRSIAVGLALTAMLSVAAVAAAKGIKISEQSDDFTLEPMGESEADCGGKRAVSGGFRAPFAPPGEAGLPFASTREDESEWRFSAGDLGGGPSDATAYAYCAKKSKFPKLREASEDETVSDGELGSVTADCPGSRRVVSGGFEFQASITPVAKSRRTGRRSWTVDVYASSGNIEVEAFAYCAKDVKLKARSSETPLTTGEVETEEARCKRKERVVSGGFDTATDGVDTLGIASASRRAGKRAWEATAFAETNPQTLTTYAYCLKQPKEKK